MMEGQNIREEEVAELLKTILHLYLYNEDEWEKLMGNEISISAQIVLQNAEGDTNLMLKRAKGLQSLGKMILQKVN
ncbi:exported protein family 1, putative [Plasmodium reichenowi]|uniref:Exported protein family 1, putative n=1 Tax=Plasmodium reichenowi TaxID=5854 RepID=A0A2P9D4Q4_PLARE|nr:exported protein family 1, putative [Plasmodium reichenowi]